jgi:hypothetical protein
MILLKKVFISRDISFFENQPYFKEKKTQESYTIDPNGMVFPQPRN